MSFNVWEWIILIVLLENNKYLVCLVQWKYFEFFWSLHEIILSLWDRVSVCGWLVLASPRPIFLSSQLVGAPGFGAVTSYPLPSSCDWPDLLVNLISLPFEFGIPFPSWFYQFLILPTQVNSDSGMYNFLSGQFSPPASPISIHVRFWYAFSEIFFSIKSVSQPASQPVSK